MNVQLQCVYAGSPRERHIAHRKARRSNRLFMRMIKALIALVVCAVIIFGYCSFSQYLTTQAVASDNHRACIATSIAAIQNSEAAGRN